MLFLEMLITLRRLQLPVDYTDCTQIPQALTLPQKSRTQLLARNINDQSSLRHGVYRGKESKTPTNRCKCVINDHDEL